MLSQRQQEEFERLGLARLPAAIPLTDVATMRERFWEFLSTRYGLRPDRPDTWTLEHPRHLQALKRSGVFNPMASAPVRHALDELLGAGGWQAPRTWGLPLVTFPGPGTRWNVPTNGWHVDSYGPDHGLPGVTVFTFLAPVAAGGGGTVVLARSHRLFNRHIATTGTWRPAAVKAALGSAHPWLRALWGDDQGTDRVARYLDEGALVDGCHLRVQELTGQPGDVVLMHPRTLHAPAPNSQTTARLMLVEIINRNR